MFDADGHKVMINNLVTLGTPIRADYTFNESVIGKHLNVFSYHDDVQRTGGMAIWVPGIGIAEIPADRQIDDPRVRNIDATSTASGHGDLHGGQGSDNKDSATWDQKVVPEINK